MTQRLPQHDETLPTLHDVVLDEAAVDALFRDVAASPKLVGVAVKRAGGLHGEDAGADLLAALSEARRALREGAAFAVQLRYQRDGREWWDTLMRVPEGVRLVRIAHDPD
ncbi:MAG: hypothetical protein ACHREM_16245 [Polyangiales bacterium]